jgi:hypothetical protein
MVLWNVAFKTRADAGQQHGLTLSVGRLFGILQR